MAQEQTVSQLRALAHELVELSSTYQPSPPGAFGHDLPIITKATELITTAQQPLDHATIRLTQVVEAAVIRTLVDLKAIHAIPTLGSISLADIASIASAQPSLLERLLRVVVSTGFLHQTEKGEYAHTHVSVGYTSGAGAFYSLLYDELVLPMVHIREYLSAKRPTHGLVEPSGEDSMTHNPVTWLARQEGKTAFEIMEQDPERLQAFQRVLGSVAHIKPFTGFYDFGRLALSDDDEGEEIARPVFVDIGGGHGHAIAEILKAHPSIKPSQCILQDRPAVIEQAQLNGSLPSGVQFMPHDYFTPQPIRHARAYHLRAIAHDLSDANLVKVLRQIVPAMAPDSKVLIADEVLPERLQRGPGEGLVGLMDMMMFCIGGKERTEKNFRKVMKDAGLQVDAVWRAEGKGFGIVEASLSV